MKKANAAWNTSGAAARCSKKISKAKRYGHLPQSKMFDIMDKNQRQNLFKNLKSLLATGQTDRVLNVMLNNASSLDSHFENEIILLSGEYQQWQKDFRLGLEPLKSTLNRINFALLEIIDLSDSQSEIVSQQNGSKRDYKLIYDSSKETSPESWTAYNSFHYLNGKIPHIDNYMWPVRQGYYEGSGLEFSLSAEHENHVGLQLPIQRLNGFIEIEYLAHESGAKNKGNLMIQCIPMKHNKPGQTGYIEVGSETQDDPQNPFSPYRKKYIIPATHIGDKQWHHLSLEFDFTYIPDAFYCILAPRINESALQKGRGSMGIRNIKIYG